MSWGAVLNGVYLSGGTNDVTIDHRPSICYEMQEVGCLGEPPEGLGVPNKRTEDVTYAQRDGVRHFNDWYEPRFITLTGTIAAGVCGCTDAAADVQALMQAWKRDNEDTELVIFPDCYESGELGLDPPVEGGGTVTRTNLATAPRANRWVTGANELGPSSTATGWSTLSLQPTGGPSDGPDTFARATDLYGSFFGTIIYLNIDNSNTDPIPAGDGAPVTEGLPYTFSTWMRSSVNGVDFSIGYRFYNSAGNSVGGVVNTNLATGVAANTWTRGSTSFTPPAGATRVVFYVYANGFTVGMTTDVTGIMLEQAAMMGTYFDGETDDFYDSVNDEWETYEWTGTTDESTSTQSTQDATHSYQFPWGFGVGGFGEGPFGGTGGEDDDQSLTGPFGIVGRPRVATYDWLPGPRKIAQFTLRFDAVDQRIFILDPCGNPGYERCTDIYPENVAGCVMEPLCSPICATGQNGDVVEPTTISVGGTETVYPEITLWPNLTNPIIENTTTLKYISYAGTIIDYPVFINTENMTATQNGVSMTHLLSGTLDFSMSPGEFTLRLLSQSTDSGRMSICTRDTVINV